jgi:Xaa-Pro aminopeptidase
MSFEVMRRRLGAQRRARKWLAAEIGHDIRHGKIRDMTDVLIYADTTRSAEMRHEIPLVVPDPFLYAEVAGTPHVVVSSIEATRIAELGTHLKVHALEEFGWDELVDGGMGRQEAGLEIIVRACRALGAVEAKVPSEFPIELGDRLRAAAISIAPDHELFARRRRMKNEAELEGIRRAQRAAEAGMTSATELLRAAESGPDGLLVGSEPLTSERLADQIRDAVIRAGATADHFVVSHGPQTAIGHELGSGRIQAAEPIVIDLWPRDPESACFADMTRTFVVGEIPDELRHYHELTLQSLERSRQAVKPGAAGADVYGVSCEPYEQAGLPTQRTKQPGQPLEEGFYHSLGHGVGLEIHEAPLLGRAPDELVAGDVITLEPGCYRPGFGGCRLEDLVYVTEEGAELLTDFPYALEP